MAIEVSELDDEGTLEVELTGKLVARDYEEFVPSVERLVGRHGKIRMLVEMRDFHGWTRGALWEDTKFAARHFDSIERLAVVGEKKWERGLATFCKPFTSAEVRYFDQTNAGEACAWVLENRMPTSRGACAARTGSGRPGSDRRFEPSGRQTGESRSSERRRERER
jgi:hypothetical protein